MSREILLVGGERHGETITVEDSPTFKYGVSQREAEIATTYIVCQAGDGTFYAVFEPSNDDPSQKRMHTMRAILKNAMGE